MSLMQLRKKVLKLFLKMTGLDSIQENEESAAAFLYLIALAIKK